MGGSQYDDEWVLPSVDITLVLLLGNLAMERVQLEIASLDGKHLYQNIHMPVLLILVSWEALP